MVVGLFSRDMEAKGRSIGDLLNIWISVVRVDKPSVFPNVGEYQSFSVEDCIYCGSFIYMVFMMLSYIPSLSTW